MISDDPFYNRKINTLAAFLIITLISFTAAAIIISRAEKLKRLEKPLPLLIHPYSEEAR